MKHLETLHKTKQTSFKMRSWVLRKEGAPPGPHQGGSGSQSCVMKEAGLAWGAEKSRLEKHLPASPGANSPGGLSLRPGGGRRSPLRIPNQRFPSLELGAHVYTIVSEAQIKLITNVVQRWQ